MLLGLLLNKLMQYGTLRVIDYKGKSSEYHGTKGPMVTIRLHDRSLNRKIFLTIKLLIIAASLLLGWSSSL